MLRRALTTAVAIAVAASITGVVTSASGDVSNETLQLIDTGATIDVFLAGGDASHTGDREVFRDTLIWAKDRSPAGKAEGHCTVIDASTATSTCTIVTTLVSMKDARLSSTFRIHLSFPPCVLVGGVGVLR